MEPTASLRFYLLMWLQQFRLVVCWKQHANVTDLVRVYSQIFNRKAPRCSLRQVPDMFSCRQINGKGCMFGRSLEGDKEHLKAGKKGAGGRRAEQKQGTRKGKYGSQVCVICLPSSVMEASVSTPLKERLFTFPNDLHSLVYSVSNGQNSHKLQHRKLYLSLCITERYKGRNKC